MSDIVNEKEWYLSKIIWFSVMSEIGAVCNLLEEGADVKTILIAAVPIVVIILRLVTKHKLVVSTKE